MDSGELSLLGSRVHSTVRPSVPGAESAGRPSREKRAKAGPSTRFDGWAFALANMRVRPPTLRRAKTSAAHDLRIATQQRRVALVRLTILGSSTKRTQSRSATIGSTAAARLAGRYDAARATTP